MTARKSIGILGTFTRDTTVYLDGSKSENLGGLFYTLLTLTSLLDGRDRIVPVANLGFDTAPQIRRALDLPGIDTQALRDVPQPNNHVYLKYTSAEDREEILKGLVPPVTLDHWLQAADVNWFVVNLTSGRDVELATLQRFRAEFEADIQLDIHSLTLGFDADGRRVLEYPEEWEAWVACVDWLQMNETEAALLSRGAPPDRFAKDLLQLGPTGVMVTLGSRGCVCALRKGRAREVRSFTATRQPNPAFPTGCGDVFGASFAYAMLHGAEAFAAWRFANAVAGHKATFEPYERLQRLRHEVSHELETLALGV